MNFSNIESSVADIEQFITFVDNEKPILSAKRGVLGKKDAYRLNQNLNYRKDVDAPNYTQDLYPAIDLMFLLLLEGRLFVKGESGNKPVLVKTPLYESFQNLNFYEKYVFMLQTYWTCYDFKEKARRWFLINDLYYLLVRIANSKVGQKLMNDEQNITNRMYSEGADFFHHLSFFGWGELEQIKEAKFTYNDSIRAFIPNEFGIKACRLLIMNAFHLWNGGDLLFLPAALKIKSLGEKDAPPFEVFRHLFPNDLASKTIEKVKITRTGVYTFKVKLTNQIWRKIRLSHSHTLHDLHKAIQGAFDFGDDHLYAFYVEGNRRTGKPIYGPDVEDAEVNTMEVAIADLGLYCSQSLFYLFDFGDEWTFNAKLETIDENAPLPLKPFIIESKGEAPDQYPDYSMWE